MKIKDGLMLCQVGDEYVVLANGNADMQIRGLTTVNETGAFIWDTLREEHDEDAVVEALLGEFETDRDTAVRDVTAFCGMLRDNGFLD